MNYTKHFDLNSSLTVSCVARFMICWVCRLYFSGLVCSVPSLDECLIEINCGPFCVAPRKLSHLVWNRVWMICNVKRYFYWTTIFLRKMAEFSLRWFGCSIKRLIFQFWVSFGSVVEFSLIRGKITAGASVFNWHIYLVNWQTFSSSFGFLSSGTRTSRSINWGWMYLRFIFLWEGFLILFFYFFYHKVLHSARFSICSRFFNPDTWATGYTIFTSDVWQIL